MKFKSKSSGTLLQIVKDELGYSSNTKARNVIKSGQISVDGTMIKIPSKEIREGASIELGAKSKSKIKEEAVLPHEIIFEDEFILVVNKRTGLITKSANRNLRTLFTSVKYYFSSKGIDTCLLVNSVDKKESGLVCFAKDLKVHKELEENWKQFKKRYYVVIPGGMLEPKGKLEDTFHENEIGLLLPGKGKKTYEVELDYRVMKSNGEFSVIRVDEISQAKNQIRALFASLKNPVVGDKKYRSKLTYEKGMASHFFSIDISYLGKDVELRTSVPKLFLKLAR